MYEIWVKHCWFIPIGIAVAIAAVYIGMWIYEYRHTYYFEDKFAPERVVSVIIAVIAVLFSISSLVGAIYINDKYHLHDRETEKTEEFITAIILDKDVENPTPSESDYYIYYELEDGERIREKVSIDEYTNYMEKEDIIVKKTTIKSYKLTEQGTRSDECSVSYEFEIVSLKEDTT